MLMRKRCLMLVPVLLLALRPAPAGACSCALPPPVAEAFADYDAVFIGRAVSYRSIWLSALGSGRAVTFEVEEAWKGISGQRVEVKTGSIGGSCGVWPASGERLIVFASRWEEGLYMGICSNTTSDAQAIEQARAEIAATGAEPIELTPGPDPEFAPPPLALPLCGAGLPGALGVLAVTILPLCLLRRRSIRRAPRPRENP